MDLPPGAPSSPPAGPAAAPPLPPLRLAPLRTAGLVVTGLLLLLAGLLLGGHEILVRADVLDGGRSDLRPAAAWGLGLLGTALLATGLWVLLRRLDTVLVARLPAPHADPGPPPAS